MTFIAGPHFERVNAPRLIDRPVNCDRFQLYVEQVLPPTLRDDHILVVDKLAGYRRTTER